jgi:hypothetical protein
MKDSHATGNRDSRRMNHEVSRRWVLKNSALAAGALWAGRGRFAFAGPAPSMPLQSTRIREVFLDLDNIHKWDDSNGDTWDPFWTGDGDMYAFNCDGRGFGMLDRNLSFNKLTGSSSHALTGSSVNSMDAYGKGGLKGADGATWKACGQECIDGTFYAFVSRNAYGNESGDPLMRQTAVNSSLIKSDDRGLTWSRTAEENYRQPMWPGTGFGAPYFVHYGQNGGQVSRGQVSHDQADRYVYASSTNGFWNDGDSYILGRVERSKLSALRSADWSYYAGGDGDQDASWSEAIGNAEPIFSSAAHCSQGPICFIPSLNLYLMVSWYNTAKMTKWFEPNRMQYDFYQAEHPWGPWELVSSYDDSFISDGHMYGPSLCARFQQRSGSEVQMSMFTAGCPFKDIPSGLYKMWEIPLILRTEPQPVSVVVPGTDPRVVYRGAWHGGDDKLASLHAESRYTNRAGDSAEFQFQGTGVTLIAEKGPEFGAAEIELDGRRTASLQLCTPTFPRISSVQVFAVTGLSSGPHTIRVVNTGSAYAAVQGFQIIA